MGVLSDALLFQDGGILIYRDWTMVTPRQSTKLQVYDLSSLSSPFLSGLCLLEVVRSLASASVLFIALPLILPKEHCCDEGIELVLVLKRKPFFGEALHL